nr:hypothetical protein [Tanacetum cinerariifolium]
GKGSTVPVESYHTPLGDLTILQPPLSSPSKVESLETELKLTKQTYGAAFTKHIKKILTDTTRVHTYSRRRRTVSTGRCIVSNASRILSTAEERISTAGVSMPVSAAGMVQESTSSPRATRDTSQTFIEVEWENIRARVEADEELTQKLQAEEREKYSEDDRTKMLVDLINQRKNYTLKQQKKMSFEEIKELFEATIRRIHDFVLMEKEGKKEVSKFAGAGGSKKDAEELDQGSSKKQRLMKLQDQFKNNQTRNHTEVYQFFDDMLKVFDMDYLVQLWYLVKERFSSTKPNDDKDRVLWVELKRLFKPDADDELQKLQRYMHDPPKWRLYDICGVFHVSIERGHDIFMLVEKDYPLKKGLITVMLVNKLQGDEFSEMANELLRKIFILANNL